MPNPQVSTRPTHNLLSTDIAETVNSYHPEVLNEVIEHVAQDDIVVVGMAWNSVVKKAHALLTSKGYTYTYLEYGSYISLWKERLSIKMWSGWPTFPQIFVKGVLIGGHDDMKVLMEKGEFQPLLEGDRHE